MQSVLKSVSGSLRWRYMAPGCRKMSSMEVANFSKSLHLLPDRKPASQDQECKGVAELRLSITNSKLYAGSTIYNKAIYRWV